MERASRRGHGSAVRPSAAVAALALLAGFGPAGLAGQDEATTPDGGVWEFNGYIGLLNDEPEFDPDEEASGTDGDQFRRDAIFGIRVGYLSAARVFVQAEAANAPVILQPPDGVLRDMNSWWLGGTLGYNVDVARQVQLFPVVGAGLVIWELDETQREFTVHYGLGGRYFVDRQLALRADARMHQVPDALGEIRGQFGPADRKQDLFNLELSVGVSYLLGPGTRGRPPG